MKQTKKLEKNLSQNKFLALDSKIKIHELIFE